MIGAQRVVLRPLTDDDVRNITLWPPYPEEFGQLDYALRDNGWLAQFPPAPTTRRYSADRDGELVGFSLLVDITDTQAEFYVAVHPSHLGHGVGKDITRLTLDQAFADLALERVHLKVRTWHSRGIKVYERYGFEATNTLYDQANGELVEFLRMEVTRASWEGRSRTAPRADRTT